MIADAVTSAPPSGDLTLGAACLLLAAFSGIALVVGLVIYTVDTIRRWWNPDR